MNKKKVIKIILIVLVIVLIIFLVDIGRKAYIISTYSKKTDEYSKITNFYIKMSNINEGTTEIWRKDNSALHKLTSSDGTRIILNAEDEDWVIVDTIDSENKETKVATQISKESSVLHLVTLGINSIYTQNFLEAIPLAFMCRITEEQLNGIDCYKIYLDEDFQLFINKENYLRVREINGNTDTGIIEYKINEVTDENVELPNLEGYEIRPI